MTLMRVAAHAGLTLVYDADDVEDCRISTPHDVHDVTPEGAGSVRRELGQAHLILHVDFKPGKRAMWVRDEDAPA